MSEVERLRTQLKRLRLHTMASIFEEEANKAARAAVSYTAFLAHLADEELAAKVDRSIQARVGKLSTETQEMLRLAAVIGAGQSR